MTRTMKSALGVKTLLTLALSLALVGGLAACGRQGPLETAPPIFDKDGKPVKRDTEKASPTAKGPNETPDPYQSNVSIRQAPLEGTGNSERH